MRATRTSPSKQAARELVKLLRARLGSTRRRPGRCPSCAPLRCATCSRASSALDLACDAPPALDGVTGPATKDEESAVRDLARRLRTEHADAYAALADRVEEELGLKNAQLPPGALGAIDTFRFEERALLGMPGS